MKTKDVFKACGYFVVSNVFVVLVEISSDGSAARCAAAGDDPGGIIADSKPRWQEIKIDKDGNNYIRFYHMPILLSSVMKI